MSAGADDHGHGHGSPFTQHHYDDAQHQFDSGKLGIWLFLAQEVLFFSALFVAYILYRFHHPEIYVYAHKYLDVKMGAINTAVLIFSSLTAAWAVRAAQLGQRKRLILCLAATLACALTFLVVKYFEYTHKIHEQLLVGKYFDPCVSSGGAPLLTKSNECPGHQGSVYWSADVPQTGCYPDFAIDQDPNKPGVQLDCTVTQATRLPKLVAKLEVDPKTKQTTPVVNKATGKPVLEVARDGNRRWLFSDADAKPIVKQCDPPTLHGEHAEGHASEPCWRYAPQPAVCRPGYFFTVRCPAGAPCAKDGKPEFDVSTGFFGDKGEADCGQAVGDINVELKNKAKAAADKAVADKAPPPPSYGLEVGACVRSAAAGFLVVRGDHEVLDRTVSASNPQPDPEYTAEFPAKSLAVATCKPAPPPRSSGDIFEPPTAKPKLGEKAIAAEPEAAAHDDHDQLYLGPPPEHTNMFFTIYFAMTGLHGIHVLVGVFVFIWLLIRAVKGHFTPNYFGPVDFAALYWHIVDLIWIFLFPLLYLIH